MSGNSTMSLKYTSEVPTDPCCHGNQNW